MYAIHDLLVNNYHGVGNVMDASKQTVGSSYYCRGKRKFGGPGKKKKACEKRKCDAIYSKGNATGNATVSWKIIIN